MRFRIHLLRLAFTAGLLLFIGTLCIPVDYTQKARIRASTYEVARQLTDTHRWRQWSKAGPSLQFRYISPLSVAATLDSPTRAVRYVITICSPLNDTSTLLCSCSRIPLWKKLYYSVAPGAAPAGPLHDLRNFMEHIPLRYGYDLRLVPVRDTLILTAAAVMPRETADAAVPRLRRDLLQFIRGMRLPADTGFYYRTFIRSGDSIHVAVGIPVHQQDKDSHGIRFLRLPAGGKLLTARYEGSYEYRKNVYQAMETFMKDQHLRPVAQPYESYLATDTLPLQGQNITIDIYYPVY